jgi:hypothetical protein
MAFNIHKKVLDQISDTLEVASIVYVHGDGLMVTSEEGSDHHKKYNSGGDVNEAVNRASYRAIYKKGDKLPETERELENEFYEQRKRDLQKQNAPKVLENGTQVYLGKKQEDEPVKKAGRPSQKE